MAADERQRQQMKHSIPYVTGNRMIDSVILEITKRVWFAGVFKVVAARQIA